MGILHNLTGWHAIILFAVILLFFGASKLPGLAKSVGQSVKIFKSEVKDGSNSTADDAAPESATGTGTRSVATAQPAATIHAVPAPHEHAPVADAR